MKPIVYTRSRGFSKFALVWFALVVIGCQVIFWIAVTDPKEADGLWVGAIGTLIFGWMLYLTWREAAQPFALVLDDCGIHALTAFAHVLCWEDIQTISRRTWRFHEFADISLRNDEAYIRKLPMFRRLTLGLDRILGRRQFSIRITALNASPDAIYTTIERLWHEANK
jgi:hypothetical protein